MDVDLAWCLSCNRHTDSSGPYCSFACQGKAGPLRLAENLPSHSNLLSSHRIKLLHTSESFSCDEDDNDEPIYHNIHHAEPPTKQALALESASTWTRDCIEAWRVKVSPTHVPRAPQRSYRTPKLLDQQRTVPPTLCMSKPQPLAEPSRQNSQPIPLTRPMSIFSTLSSRLRRLRGPGCSQALVMLSPSQSTDSLATPALSSTCSSPVDEKFPVDPWWSNDREIEPVAASPPARTIDIRHRPQRQRLPPQPASLHRAPSPPPPLIQMRQDHPAFKERGRKTYTRQATA